MNDPVREDAARYPVVRRGCGAGRQAGGVYAETGVGEHGVPIEACLLDPPLPVADALELPVRGVMLVERDGIWHVLDHVGSEHYPNVADFVEEARRFGVSRRLPRNLDFSKLTRESRLVLAHRRAIITDPAAYRPIGGDYRCPQGHRAHRPGGDVMCAGLWWEDVPRGDWVLDIDPTDRRVTRSVGDTTYDAQCAPEGVTPVYARGFFASLPLGRVAVVDDGAGARGPAADAFAKVSAARCPTALVPL